MIKTQTPESLRKDILELVNRYYELSFGQQKEFEPGDRVNYAGRVFDAHEMVNLVDSSLDFWLTSGRYCSTFEEQMARYLGVGHCSLVNSGSSANLLAFMALTSPKLRDKRILPGDEIITVAAGFPTTVTPIIHYGAVPVFVDIDIPTYNIDVSQLEDALSEKTKGIMIAHTLGNPFDLKSIKSFAQKHNLWLIEDNCDALGSEYYFDGEYKLTGTIGDIGTSSFYPPHHMTMGEGGAVYTNSKRLGSIINSFRDWGRDCWCESGQDNTCQKRFAWQLGDLPKGYDHKYIYSHFGYNLKATEMQASIGVAQLEKVSGFIQARRDNWDYLYQQIKDMEEFFVLPQATKNSKPSWFGFMILVRERAPFSRDEILQYLEGKNIQTRMLFAGNFTKHPCFNEMRSSQTGYRTVGLLENTDRVMNHGFWIGVYPGMNIDKLQFMADTIRSFVLKH